MERQAQAVDAASRLQLRAQEARPRLEALRTWLIDTRIGVADGGGAAKALDYSIKRRTGWIRAWLRDTLEKLPVWPDSRIDELLPLRPERR